jgi:hypothetical protein
MYENEKEKEGKGKGKEEGRRRTCPPGSIVGNYGGSFAPYHG